MDKPADQGEKRSGFWTTLPGILTGAAALVTAIGGLTLGLYQYGVLGAKQGQTGKTLTSATSSQRPSTEAPNGQPQQANPVSPATERGADQPTIVVTARDGTVTTVFAHNFRQMAQYDAQLHLLSGQAIAFDHIRSLEVARHFSDHAQVKISLADDKVV